MLSDDPATRQKSVLVLGGAGFIGRHAVAALLHAGVRVVVGTRFPGPMGKRAPPHPAAPDAEQREVKLERLTMLFIDVLRLPSLRPVKARENDSYT